MLALPLNDASLTSEEKELINQWVDNGAPLGDSKDLPEPQQFSEGWQIGEPDEVFALLETLYQAFDDIALRRKVFKVETM